MNLRKKPLYKIKITVVNDNEIEIHNVKNYYGY